MTSDRAEMLKRWHTGRTGAHPAYDRLSLVEQKRVLAKAGLLKPKEEKKMTESRMTTINQAVEVVREDLWEGNLGWTINLESASEIRALLRRKLAELERAIAAYNAACDSECDSEGKVEGFATMGQGEYSRRYFGPNAAGCYKEEEK